MAPLVVLITAISVIGAVAGVTIALRATRGLDAVAPPGEETGLVRIRARVRTGHEQALLALARELGLPRRADDVPYGALYLDPDPPSGFVVRTHSRIGRGLVAPLMLHGRAGHTELTYAIVKLPQDADLHPLVLGFEVQLIAAVRRISESSSIRMSGTALRDLGRSMASASPVE